MTKADIWLVSVIFAAALLILLIFHLNRSQGSYAAVSYDGMNLAYIPLSQAESRYYLLIKQESQTYNEQSGPVSITELSDEEWTDMQVPSEDYNVILYQDGKIRMIAGNCPDQICVHHSAIYATGESIICLPHKIVVEIIGEKGNELDGVAY